MNISNRFDRIYFGYEWVFWGVAVFHSQVRPPVSGLRSPASGLRLRQSGEKFFALTQHFIAMSDHRSLSVPEIC